jgi:hypothetical protein
MVGPQNSLRRLGPRSGPRLAVQKIRAPGMRALHIFVSQGKTGLFNYDKFGRILNKD